jgi:hypothetical protein
MVESLDDATGLWAPQKLSLCYVSFEYKSEVLAPGRHCRQCDSGI